MYNHCNFPSSIFYFFKIKSPHNFLSIIVDDTASCLRMSAGSMLDDQSMDIPAVLNLFKKIATSFMNKDIYDTISKERQISMPIFL